MIPYQSAQEYNDLFWGTTMPVTVMVGSNIVEVRARGSFSAAVSEPVRLAEEVPDPEDLPGCMRSLIVMTITDIIGQRSQEVANVAQLTTITSQTTQAFQTELESKFNAVGLKIKSVHIEAVESL
jgi:membrane protease subunit (stomatin/prohibitin family)